jgi:hypothetical protein
MVPLISVHIYRHRKTRSEVEKDDGRRNHVQLAKEDGWLRLWMLAEFIVTSCVRNMGRTGWIKGSGSSRGSASIGPVSPTIRCVSGPRLQTKKRWRHSKCACMFVSGQVRSGFQGTSRQRRSDLEP